MHKLLSSTNASLISPGKVSVNSPSLIRNRAEMESGLTVSHESKRQMSVVVSTIYYIPLVGLWEMENRQDGVRSGGTGG